MNINAFETKMGEMKWLLLQVIPLSMATLANKFSAGLEAATLIAALCTAVLLMLVQWHKYRLVRRQDKQNEQEHGSDR